MFRRFMGYARVYCMICDRPALYTCRQCGDDLCDRHSCAARCPLCRKVFCHDHVNFHDECGLPYI